MANNQAKTQQYANGVITKFDILAPVEATDSTKVVVEIQHSENAVAKFSRNVHSVESLNAFRESQGEKPLTKKKAEENIQGFRSWLNEHLKEALGIDKVTENSVVGKRVNYPFEINEKGYITATYLNKAFSHNTLKAEAKKKAIDEFFG